MSNKGKLVPKQQHKKPQILVVVEGGEVQSVYSDTSAQLTVVTFDPENDKVYVDGQADHWALSRFGIDYVREIEGSANLIALMQKLGIPQV
jgi:hypothetical protein